MKRLALADGIGIGLGHIMDVQGGLEGEWKFLFGGVGYRHVDFAVEDGRDRQLADLRLKGVYVEGGFRS